MSSKDLIELAEKFGAPSRSLPSWSPERECARLHGGGFVKTLNHRTIHNSDGTDSYVSLILSKRGYIVYWASRDGLDIDNTTPYKSYQQAKKVYDDVLNQLIKDKYD
jgi:hypothetical protein